MERERQTDQTVKTIAQDEEKKIRQKPNLSLPLPLPWFFMGDNIRRIAEASSSPNPAPR
jgi:hypothetical protein